MPHNPALLIEQLARDDEQMKECIVNCGTAVVTSILEVSEIELNADGNPELVIAPNRSSPENCENCYLCGNRRCTEWIYRKVANGYESLLKADNSDGVSPLKAVTNGYQDVRVLRPGGLNYPAWEEIYKFDGRRYQKWSQRDLR